MIVMHGDNIFVFTSIVKYELAKFSSFRPSKRIPNFVPVNNDYPQNLPTIRRYSKLSPGFEILVT